MHVEYVCMQHNMNASVIECVLMHRTRNAVYVVQCACYAMHECACMRRNECNSMYMDAQEYMVMHLNAIWERNYTYSGKKLHLSRVHYAPLPVVAMGAGAPQPDVAVRGLAADEARARRAMRQPLRRARKAAREPT